MLFDLDGTLYNSPHYSKKLEDEIALFVSTKISVSTERAKSILQQRRKELGTLTKTLESLGISREAFGLWLWLWLLAFPEKETRKRK